METAGEICKALGIFSGSVIVFYICSPVINLFPVLHLQFFNKQDFVFFGILTNMVAFVFRSGQTRQLVKLFFEISVKSR